MIGETQLRARRTRIKILQAIANKRGMASFSEIQNATGLSTGSIYYHIDRMREYINKNYKNYSITQKGLDILSKIDPKK
ncbi:MAG: winged helix-turn-helix domain-containing protein [Nitrososphaeraceae archaeon]